MAEQAELKSVIDYIILQIGQSHDLLIEHLRSHDPDSTLLIVSTKSSHVFNAIKLYCRSTNTEDPAKAAEWLRRYESLKSCLMMEEGYGREAGANE